MTYKNCCEVIAHYQNDLNKLTGSDKRVTPEEVFNYSPSGELYMISYWYDEAVLMYRKFGDNLGGLLK